MIPDPPPPTAHQIVKKKKICLVFSSLALTVAINGPEVQHCKGIVREAMRVGEATLLEGVAIFSLVLCPRLLITL